jgi:hypothetical protein
MEPRTKNALGGKPRAFLCGEDPQLPLPITPEVAIPIIEPDRVKVAPPVMVSDKTASTVILVPQAPVPVLSPDRAENSAYKGTLNPFGLAFFPTFSSPILRCYCRNSDS